MRSILFEIPLDGQVSLGPLGTWPVFGLGLLFAGWCLFGIALGAILWMAVGRGKPVPVPLTSLITWGVIDLLIVVLPKFVKKGIPVYGYGLMLFLGFLVAGSVAAARLRRRNVNGEIAWDAAMWIFISGIAGARLFYILQYRDRFPFGKAPLPDLLQSLINLPDGGLVFYGGLISAGIAYYMFCRSRRVRPLALADILVTSVLIGYAFGRMGCFMNGCCYGDFCDLPWAVTYPQNSLVFTTEVQQGYLTTDALRSLPVHPTQLYSTLSGLVLAGLTWAYWPFRRKDGEVLALGWLLYPVCRFTVEFLRADEQGKFGTSLTISQWVSLAMFAAGLVYLVVIERYSTRHESVLIDPPR